ncbi:putative ubiquitin carboxyl-terminal hydrolase [Triangularia setosa]|uniref:Ubiquitin carboxyl-terminal hydrolase n=1 Tax=Triangularia setosa TaxID=2587417 RepID=A0AAN7A0C5_9PEZI|nr:putative ubiquitin carboxyl-terminal hydrolase [Podospora setosa]
MRPKTLCMLVHTLGLSSALEFHDVLSLDDVDLLALVPRPTFALILVFPTSHNYEPEVVEKDKDVIEYTGSGDEDIVWYKQTINNACGLYGILHAVSNGDARDFIIPGSHLHHLLTSCTSLKPLDRATFLEDDEQLESAYKAVALQGDSEVPANPEDEVDFHYVCFVKSHKNSHLYELDGDRKGPIDCGWLGDDDILSGKGLSVVCEFIQRISRSMGGFSLLALAPAQSLQQSSPDIWFDRFPN